MLTTRSSMLSFSRPLEMQSHCRKYPVIFTMVLILWIWYRHIYWWTQQALMDGFSIREIFYSIAAAYPFVIFKFTIYFYKKISWLIFILTTIYLTKRILSCASDQNKANIYRFKLILWKNVSHYIYISGSGTVQWRLETIHYITASKSNIHRLLVKALLYSNNKQNVFTNEKIGYHLTIALCRSLP